MSLDVAQLEARLTAAEDRLAIMDLEAEYARSWDAGDSAGWAGLFTAEGVFELTGIGHQPKREIRGTDELAAFCTEVNGYYRGLHFNNPPRIQLGDGRATGQVHFQWLGLFRPGNLHSGERRAAGYYRISYRKTDGLWRMERRIETQIAGGSAEAFDPFINTDISLKERSS